MIEFYLEYYNAESFTDEYKQLDTYNLSVRDSACLVKILIDYGMYYEARQLIDKYGYADVDATKLFMFMVHELEASVNEEEYKNKISEYVFKKHLYNEQLLTYMVEHYNSTNTDMYVLWKTSKEFGVNVDSLSERIISQMMFTNVYSNRLAEVFADYYNNVAGYSIVKAYAAYNSYNYVIKNKKADPVIFKVIERAYKDKIGLPLLCYIAWLKEKSLELSLLNESDIKKTAQSILDELCEKEIVDAAGVFAQIGYSDYLPRKYSYKKFLDRDEFSNEMGKADIVITHGGTGAIIGAVKKGKKVIAVPRLVKYGEHVDDHQLQLIKQFDELNLICPCRDTNKLSDALDTVQKASYNGYESNTSNIISSIEEYIKGI